MTGLFARPRRNCASCRFRDELPACAAPALCSRGFEPAAAACLSGLSPPAPASCIAVSCSEFPLCSWLPDESTKFRKCARLLVVIVISGVDSDACSWSVPSPVCSGVLLGTRLGPCFFLDDRVLYPVVPGCGFPPPWRPWSTANRFAGDRGDLLSSTSICCAAQGLTIPPAPLLTFVAVSFMPLPRKRSNPSDSRCHLASLPSSHKTSAIADNIFNPKRRDFSQDLSRASASHSCGSNAR
mmetsp:Transcript_39132/g.92277  ORF Transcript_39132/g.92277 Transcript_39132/m.92277 type:complete len:240 (+) Transcript_39132:782-1501(+)